MPQPYFKTWSKQNSGPKLSIKSVHEFQFVLENNKLVTDLTSVSYQASFGLKNEFIENAIAKQLSTMPVASPKAEFHLKTEVSEKLLEFMGLPAGRIFYTTSGAEAVENALKISRLTSGRKTVAARQNSYHGATMGALSVTGDWRNKEPLTADQWTTRIPCPDQENAFQNGKKILSTQLSDLSAMICETITGHNGVIIPDENWFKQWEKLLRDNGSHLILDEVICGFYRTGMPFGYQHYDFNPHFVTLAKGMTGGFIPFGAVWVDETIAEEFEDRVLPAGTTNYAHPLGLAALGAVIDLCQETKFNERRLENEEIFSTKVKSWEKLNSVHEVRQKGLLAAIDCDISFTWEQAIEAGVSIFVKENQIVLSPPLAIDCKLLEQGLEIVTKLLEGNKNGP